jgi:hypothetical protein
MCIITDIIVDNMALMWPDCRIRVREIHVCEYVFTMYTRMYTCVYVIRGMHTIPEYTRRYFTSIYTYTYTFTYT